MDVGEKVEICRLTVGEVSSTTVNYTVLCFRIRIESILTTDEPYIEWSARTKNYTVSAISEFTMTLNYALHIWTLCQRLL